MCCSLQGSKTVKEPGYLAKRDWVIEDPDLYLASTKTFPFLLVSPENCKDTTLYNYSVFL